MLRKLINFIILSAIAVLAWFLNLKYDTFDFSKISYSFIAVAVAYLVFKLFLDGVIGRRIKGSKTRYSFRKTIQFLFIIVSVILIIRIWILDPQALLLAYGLFTAGVAIALQDVFKNFAGSIAIFISGIYRVGDRIEIDSTYGDVIDIGIFYTTLLEMREWVDGDQSTGRIIMLPNGKVLYAPLHNYTKDHNFIWDEFSIPITYKSDWRQAIEHIQQIVRKETSKMAKQASAEISHLEERYYLSKKNSESSIFTTLTDNWINLNIRYVVEIRERRLMQNKLSLLILEALENMPNVQIASATMTVTSITSNAKKKF